MEIFRFFISTLPILLILRISTGVVCSRSFVFVVGRYNYYSVLSVMNTKVATPNLYTFLSRLFSLNSTTLASASRRSGRFPVGPIFPLQQTYLDFLN